MEKLNYEKRYKTLHDVSDGSHVDVWTEMIELQH